jgi:hypothetical protein
MKRYVIVLLSAAGFALAARSSAQTGLNVPSPNPNAPGTGNDAFVSDVSQRTFTVTGTVVSERAGQLVLRIDDGGHHIPFQQPQDAERLRAGSRVSVTYHPTGATGQVAEQVQVLEPARPAHRGAGQ